MTAIIGGKEYVGYASVIFFVDEKKNNCFDVFNDTTSLVEKERERMYRTLIKMCDIHEILIG